MSILDNTPLYLDYVPTMLAASHTYFSDDLPLAIITPQQTQNKQRSVDDLTEIPHYHDFTEVAIVAAGQADHWIDHTCFPVKTGDVFAFAGKQQHYFSNCNKLQLVNIMFDPQRLPLPHDYLNRLSGYHAFFTLEPQYRIQHQFRSRLRLEPRAVSKLLAICNTIAAELATDDPGKAAYAVAELTRALVFLARHYGQHPSGEGTALLRLGDVISLLESRYAEEWRLDELATRAGLARSRFLEVFHAATGHSPIDYLLRIRLAKAMDLLRHSHEPITAIAFAVGFNDSNYFTRQFRKCIGSSPRQYRQQETGR